MAPVAASTAKVTSTIAFMAHHLDTGHRTLPSPPLPRSGRSRVGGRSVGRLAVAQFRFQCTTIDCNSTVDNNLRVFIASHSQYKGRAR